ncbi:MAG: zinc ABC transporter substrate-binding protein [Oscillospiraceae bacterium]|jgi:zinc transport system substrate-binding protein|nr:zinc ABC transporter substrate-binding protein [Oscillospiraceae bacterium]
MKKMISIALALCLALTLAACGNTPAENTPPGNPAAANTFAETADKISVVTTIFPPYDFTRAIAGDKAEATMLLPPAAESHSYEPTPQDIIKIQNCDVFVYNGGDSDAWVDDVLASMDTSAMKIVKFIDCVEVVEEEIVEGMEDDEHEHEDEHEDEHGHGEMDLDAVEDRPLSDFAGDWKDCGPYLKDGTVDAYFEHASEEMDLTPEEVKAMYIQMMRTDHPVLAVTANSISVGGVAARATYKGYEIVEGEHGSSAWYKYETDGSNGVPKYWLFNDHGYTAGVPDEEIPHIHAIYSDESFEALLAIENWAAMYFAASVTGDDILEVMLGHSHEEGEEHSHEHEIDEHVWTSPRNAKLIVARIADALCGTDPVNAVTYKQNADAYIAKLDTLDAAFQAAVAGAARKTIVFGDRFPFRYFADAYNLDYFAAFPGCSTETEASAATVTFLIDKIKAERIPVVFRIELSNGKMADTIAEETGAKVLELHACHNISKNDFESGKTYLDIMTANVDALKEALQ